MEGITYIPVINLSINSHQPSNNLTAFIGRAFRNFVFLKLIITEQVINYILCIEHLYEPLAFVVKITALQLPHDTNRIITVYI